MMHCLCLRWKTHSDAACHAELVLMATITHSINFLTRWSYPRFDDPAHKKAPLDALSIMTMTERTNPSVYLLPFPTLPLSTGPVSAPQLLWAVVTCVLSSVSQSHKKLLPMPQTPSPVLPSLRSFLWVSWSFSPLWEHVYDFQIPDFLLPKNWLESIICTDLGISELFPRCLSLNGLG